jgi:hypothetical protein
VNPAIIRITIIIGNSAHRMIKINALKQNASLSIYPIRHCRVPGHCAQARRHDQWQGHRFVKYPQRLSKNLQRCAAFQADPATTGADKRRHAAE